MVDRGNVLIPIVQLRCCGVRTFGRRYGLAAVVQVLATRTTRDATRGRYLAGEPWRKAVGSNPGGFEPEHVRITLDP